jgi:poly(A) polymerase
MVARCDAPWMKWPGLRLIAQTLGPADVRAVGGAVRDTISGQSVTDIDLATRLSPQDVMMRLEKVGIKTNPTGIAHGTVTAVTAEGPIEITTLRRDVSTDGRRATVAFTDDWREDAARRDFTINALYADLESGEIFDYFGGVDDLNAGRVAFIGAPLARIAEDHLRILRFFRFQARFGRGAPDEASLAACTARANDLMALSRERIADELLKLLALDAPAPTMALMLANGIWKPVLPELTSADALLSLTEPDAVRRLASLLPPNPAIADTVSKRLKLSKAINKRLVLAAGRGERDAANPRALAYARGCEAARDRLILLGEREALKQLDGWSLPRLPISGGALVKRGIAAGPDVAYLLKWIEEQWISEGFPNAARVEAIADEVVGK